MNTATQTIVDDNGIEITVKFEHEVTPGYYHEPGNPGTWVDPLGYVNLLEVWMEIGEQKIDLTPLLWPGSKEEIIKKLVY